MKTSGAFKTTKQETSSGHKTTKTTGMWRASTFAYYDTDPKDSAVERCKHSCVINNDCDIVIKKEESKGVYGESKTKNGMPP
jgi:hypothetical protein